MSDLCSWVTGLFTPRRAKAAFGVTLPIEAELASTQISNVHLVQCGGGEPCALKVICFEKVRRAIVEREAAAQKLAHDHESVLTLLKDEMVPTGIHAVRTPHTHTTLHAHCTHTARILHAHCTHTACILHAYCMHTACTPRVPPSLHVQPTPTCWSCACSFRSTAAARWRRRSSCTPPGSPRRWRSPSNGSNPNANPNPTPKASPNIDPNLISNPTQVALAIFAQYAAAVAHCHERGVIHRDIKLTNIYCGARSSAAAASDGLGVAHWVLADFGSALLSAELVAVDSRELLASARDEVTTALALALPLTLALALAQPPWLWPHPYPGLTLTMALALTLILALALALTLTLTPALRPHVE